MPAQRQYRPARTGFVGVAASATGRWPCVWQATAGRLASPPPLALAPAGGLRKIRPGSSRAIRVIPQHPVDGVPHQPTVTRADLFQIVHPQPLPVSRCVISIDVRGGWIISLPFVPPDKQGVEPISRQRYNGKNQAGSGNAMGIRFYCPNGHKLNVKDFQAGHTGICPHCGAKMRIPVESTRRSSQSSKPGSKNAASETGAAAPAARNIPVAMSRTVAAAPASAAVQAGLSDPLAEAGDVVWYVRPTSGGQFGPAKADVMRAWFAEGRVGTDTLVWREGWRDWQEAGGVFPAVALRPGLSRSGRHSGTPRAIPGPITPSTHSRHAAAISGRSSSARWRWPRSLVLAVLLVILCEAMKIQQFLDHHGIAANPFADEDAQTDLVFKGACIRNTFHPTWDKIYGDPVGAGHGRGVRREGLGQDGHPAAIGPPPDRLQRRASRAPGVRRRSTTISTPFWTASATAFPAGGGGPSGCWNSGGCGTISTPSSRWPSRSWSIGFWR